MTRSELQASRALWTIPAERAKNGIANDVPLTPAAIAILNAVPKIESKAGLIFTTTGESAFSDLEEALDVQVRLGRRRRTEEVGLVGATHVQRVAVGLGVDGDRGDAELLEGADDANRYFAAVRDEDLLEHRGG